MKLKIYTDGACSGNPGKGGWAAIILDNNSNLSSISGSESNTTNNRMELLAPIMALKKIKEKSEVTIFTDSKYVKNGIEVWIHKWKDNGWMTAEKKPVKNKDLWTKLDKIQKTKKIKWEWVKGHSSDKLNNEVDRIAREQAESIGYNEKI